MAQRRSRRKRIPDATRPIFTSILHNLISDRSLTTIVIYAILLMVKELCARFSGGGANGIGGDVLLRSKRRRLKFARIGPPEVPFEVVS